MAEANREGITMRWKNGQTREADDRKRVNERKSLKLLLRERVGAESRQRSGKRERERERGAKKEKSKEEREEEEFIVSSATLRRKRKTRARRGRERRQTRCDIRRVEDEEKFLKVRS